MGHETRLTTLYDAFNRRDVETALAGLRADVQWPNGWEGGWLHGREAVRAYWLRQWAEINPHVEPVSFAQSSPDVIRVTVHQVVRNHAGEVVVDTQVLHTYTLDENGLVLRMEIEPPA